MLYVFVNMFVKLNFHVFKSLPPKFMLSHFGRRYNFRILPKTVNLAMTIPRLGSAGHRHRPLHDFGYVALDIVGTIPEDNGIYTCRATNGLGYDETSAILKTSRECRVAWGPLCG